MLDFPRWKQLWFWFVALAALSKSATPERVRRNSVAEAPVLAPATRRTRLK